MSRFFAVIFISILLVACSAKVDISAPLPATFTPLPTRTPRPTFTPTPLPSSTPVPPPSPTLAISPTPTGLPVIEAARWGTGKTQSIAWSPDGKYLAAATQSSIYLLGTGEWQLLDREDWTSLSIRQLIFSPNSSHLVLSCSHELLVVFTLMDDNLQFSWSSEHISQASDFTFSTDGSLLVNEASGMVLRLSDGSILSDGEVVLSPDGSMMIDQGVVTRLSDGTSLYRLDITEGWFSTDGQWLATYRYIPDGKQIEILRLSDKSLLYSWQVSDIPISELRFLTGNSVLLIQSQQLQLYRIEDQKQLLDLEDVGNRYLLSPDGTLLTTWDTNGSTLNMYDVASGHKLYTHQGSASTMDELVFSPDSSYLLARDKGIQVLNARTGRVISELEDESYSYYGQMAFAPPSPDSNRALQIAGISQSRLKIWDTLSGKLLNILTQEPRRVDQLVFSSDDQHLAFLVDEIIAGQIPLSSSSSGLSYDPYLTIDYSQERYGAFDFENPVISPQGDAILYRGDRERVLISLEDGSQLTSLETGSWYSGSSMGFSTDGSLIYLLAHAEDYQFVLFNAQSGKILKYLPSPMNTSYSYSFAGLSTSGLFLVAIDHNGSIYVINATSGRQVVHLDSGGRVYNAALSLDGKYLAVCPDGMAAQIYSLADGRLVQELGQPGDHGQVAFSDDGQYLARSTRFSLQLWRIADSRLVAELSTGLSMSSLAFSHGGRYLASGTEDGLIQLWDLQPLPEFLPTTTPTTQPSATPTPLSASSPTPQVQLVTVPPAFSGTPFPQSAQVIQVSNVSSLRLLGQVGYGSPKAVAWSPDGQQVVVMTGNGLRIYATNSWDQTAWVETGSRVLDAVFSPDGSVLALAAGGEILRYQPAEQRWLVPLLTDPMENTNFSDLVFSQDGRFIAGQSDNGKLVAWDAQQGIPLYTFQSCSYSQGMGIAPDNSLIAVFCRNPNRLLQFRLEDGSQFADLLIPGEEWGAAYLSEDLLYLSLGGVDDSVKLFRLDLSLQSGVQLEEVLSIPMKWLSALSTSPDRRYFAIGTNDEITSIWDIASGKVVSELDISEIDDIYGADPVAFYFSPESSALFITTDQGPAIMWDYSLGDSYTLLEGFHDVSWMGEVAFSPDSREILLAEGEGVTWYSIEDGSRHKQAAGRLETMTVLPDGSILTLDTYTTSRDDLSHLELYRVEGERLKFLWEITLGSEDDYLDAMAISPDGKYIAVGDSSGVLRLLQASDGMVVDEIIASDKRISNVEFSPDGSQLATPNQLWRIQDGKFDLLISSLGDDIHDRWFFSPDSTLLGIIDYQDIQLVSAADGSPIRLITEAGNSTTLTFSPDSSILASGDSSGLIYLWDMMKGTKLSTLAGHVWGILDLTFSPDGETLASLSQDGTLRLWGILTEP